MKEIKSERKYPRGHPEIEILDSLLHFSREKPELKLYYIDDVIDFLEEKGFITEMQLRKLNEIYENYHVDYFMKIWKDEQIP